MSNSADFKIDTNVMIKGESGSVPFSRQTPHPALMQLARALGVQAGRHFQKYRYAGLGKIALIQHQMDFDAKGIGGF